MQMGIHPVFYLIATCIIFTMACDSAVDAPDVSGIEIEPVLVRYERLIAGIDTNQLSEEVDQLTTAYPDFSDVFFYQVIADTRAKNDIYQTTRSFLQDSLIMELHGLCEGMFGTFESFESDLRLALKYFRYYFPKLPIPDIYTCMTGFEVGAFTIGNDVLGIGLEFYLGDAFQHYDPNLFPIYIQRTMNADHLVPKVMQALIANYLGEARGTMLLDFMIRNGVELYIKKQLLPHEPDTVILEFSEEQLKWLADNEAQIWAHLLNEELLHSINYRQFQKLITPSPNVPNMPSQAPGRVGNWVGYKIVESYVKKHPQKSLTDLLSFEDAQKVLAESRYRPRQSI